MVTHGLLLLRDSAGLVFRPPGRIAMVRPEREGRLEVVDDQGRPAFRPGALEDLDRPPLVRVAPDALVNPAHAVPDGEGFLAVAGWRVPGRLPPPAPAQPEPDPLLPEVGVRASEVLYLRACKPRSSWVTDEGEKPVGNGRSGVPLTGRQAAALHPGLVPAGKLYHVNPRRLASLLRTVRPAGFRLTFDDGRTLPLTWKSARVLTRNLGLPSPDDLPGETPLQRDLLLRGVRRWPSDLVAAPSAFLRQEFAGSPERLIANLAFETLEARARGDARFRGDSHRSWYYSTSAPCLYRAGLLDPTAPSPPRFAMDLPDEEPPPTWSTETPLDKAGAWRLTCLVLADLVRLRHFCFRDLGFRNLHPELLLVGRTRPEVVVLVEKVSLLETARALHETLGVTVLVTGGVPPMVATEFLAEALLALGIREILLVSFCDHDPVGWDMPVVLSRQAGRYDVATAALHRLVTPDRFTPEEIQRLARPIAAPNARYRSRIARWIRESGGTNGQAMALLANHLPVERLLEALRQILAPGGNIPLAHFPKAG